MGSPQTGSASLAALANPDMLERIVEANAALVGLRLPDDCKAGVIHQLALNARLISPLLNFDLPEDAIPLPEQHP